MNKCEQVRECVCVLYVNMYSISVYIYVCIYICMYIYTYIHIDKHIHIYARVATDSARTCLRGFSRCMTVGAHLWQNPPATHRTRNQGASSIPWPPRPCESTASFSSPNGVSRGAHPDSALLCPSRHRLLLLSSWRTTHINIHIHSSTNSVLNVHVLLRDSTGDVLRPHHPRSCAARYGRGISSR